MAVIKRYCGLNYSSSFICPLLKTPYKLVRETYTVKEGTRHQKKKANFMPFGGSDETQVSETANSVFLA